MFAVSGIQQNDSDIYISSCIFVSNLFQILFSSSVTPLKKSLSIIFLLYDFEITDI